MSIALSGSLVISGSIFATQGITGSFSGSATSASYADTLGGLPSSSFAPAATFNTVSQSFATTSGSIAGRMTIVEGQDATTGSNTFTGVQYISQASNAISFTSTASLYTDGGLRVARDSFVSGTAYFNNIIVYGTSSIEYITSSQVDIGANIITVNTDTPAVRFGGLSVFDSGSTRLTGSMLWDSQTNHWVYSNPSGSSYSGGMIMSGPRSSALGSEQGTTNNALMKGQGGDHITSSLITETGTATTFYTDALYVTASNTVGVGLTTPYSNGLTIKGTNDDYSLTIAQSNASNAGWGMWADTSGNYKLSRLGGGTYSSPALTFTLAGLATFSQAATFSSTIAATSANLSGNIVLNRPSTSAGNNIEWRTANTLNWYIGTRGLVDNNFYIVNEGLSANNLILNASTGAATFSDEIRAGSWIATANNRGFTIRNAANTAYRTAVQMNSSNVLIFGQDSDIAALTLGVGSEAMRITSGGNVCIGTTVTDVKLHVYNASGRTDLRVESAGGDGAFSTIQVKGGGTNAWWTIVTNSSALNGAVDTLSFYKESGSAGVKMVIQNNGFVGIGTTSPNAQLSLYGASTAYMNFRNSTNISSTFGFVIEATGNESELWNYANGYMRFGTNNTERMRIGSDGIFYYGTTTYNSALKGILFNPAGFSFFTIDGNTVAVGTAAININRLNNDGKLLSFQKNTSETGYISTNTYSLPSDLNFKKNINTLELGLNLVTKLRAVSYNHKIDDDDAALSTGFIAQELEQSLSELGVEQNQYYILQNTPNEDKKQSQYWLDYTKMIPVLVKAIQELEARVKELENK